MYTILLSILSQMLIEMTISATGKIIEKLFG